MGMFKQAKDEPIADQENVVPFERPASNTQEPLFTSEERRAIRRMLRQFANIRLGCPTARREGHDD